MTIATTNLGIETEELDLLQPATDTIYIVASDEDDEEEEDDSEDDDWENDDDQDW